MRRYWIEKKQIQNQIVHFTNEQFHHIFEVCRQEIGHHFEVITEDSIAYLVQVLEIKKKTATALITESRTIHPAPRPHIHIALSISRYPVMDSIMERAVELGVRTILPFVSDYSFIRKTKELPLNKIDRWKKIIISATQQSGRGDLMAVETALHFEEFIKFINPNSKNLCLFAYEGERLKSIEQTIKDHKIKFSLNGIPIDSEIENIWLIIGSEGGFSKSEVQSLVKLGLDPVSLGSQILRVETACLTLVAVLKYAFGLLK